MRPSSQSITALKSVKSSFQRGKLIGNVTMKIFVKEAKETYVQEFIREKKKA